MMDKLQEMLDIWQGVLRMDGWCIRARYITHDECGTWCDNDAKMALIKLPEPSDKDEADRLALTDELAQAFLDIKDAAQAEINALHKKIKELQANVERAQIWAAGHCQKAIEATKRENYYKELVEKRWATIDDYSRAVADEILDIITAAGKTTPELIEKLRMRFGNKGVKHG